MLKLITILKSTISVIKLKLFILELKLKCHSKHINTIKLVVFRWGVKIPFILNYSLFLHPDLVVGSVAG